jgi:hypothetical protein
MKKETILNVSAKRIVYQVRHLTHHPALHNCPSEAVHNRHSFEQAADRIHLPVHSYQAEVDRTLAAGKTGLEIGIVGVDHIAQEEREREEQARLC